MNRFNVIGIFSLLAALATTGCLTETSAPDDGEGTSNDDGSSEIVSTADEGSNGGVAFEVRRQADGFRPTSGIAFGPQPEPWGKSASGPSGGPQPEPWYSSSPPPGSDPEPTSKAKR